MIVVSVCLPSDALSQHLPSYLGRFFFFLLRYIQKNEVVGSLGGSVVKNLPDNAGNMGSIPDPGGSHMPQSD